MNHDPRLDGLVQGRGECGDRLPFSRQNLPMEIAIRRWRTRRQRFDQPGRGIIGNARKWAKAREKDAQLSHLFGLLRRTGAREANSGGYSMSLMPASRPSSCAAAAGVISPARTL